MNPLARLSLLAFGAVLLLGCGPPEPRSKEDAEALGRDTDETVFDDMIQTQDKARAVEGVTMQHKADMDAAIDQATDADAEAGQ
jgi:hypothetical protein